MGGCMKPSPFQLTRARRCGYCGSRSHCTQYCPKTNAGRMNIAIREQINQLKNRQQL
ncbi:hypothetical protein EDWATA_01884 [Edwardsiella tarda ATCC 23685]|uniref:Uncharacterized protein n=2 Tax=Edwardsiella tarda TaxID=636 RepID=D4F556_EDWTA|nr:hypothetical protein EDWATA_01884 [Edwardsiella tarda ATCC 23685]